MTTESPRAARSREKLLDAATELLVEAGPRAVTVDAVAELSGVAKSTLYRHFASRDEMLVEVVRCNVPQLGTPDLDGGFEPALRGLLASVAETLRQPEWSRIMPALLLLRNTMPELAAVADADSADKFDTLEAVVSLGVREGALPGDIDLSHAAALLYGPMLFASLIGDDIDIDDLADQVAERFVASYRTITV